LPVLTAPPQAEDERRAWLTAQLDALFGTAGGATPASPLVRVSVAVLDFETGAVVYQREPRALLNAASNVKLVTTAAALSTLGPEYRFRTILFGPSQGPGRYLESGGELAGDLYLKGTGDPTLGIRDLEELARRLHALGVRRVRGQLVVDGTFFDERVMPPAYEQKEESASFRAPSSALSLEGNTTLVTIAPGPLPGAPALVTLEPASSYLTLQGRITTASRGPAWPRVETRTHGDGHTQVVLSGRIEKTGEPMYFRRRIGHPALFIGHTFIQILESRGIKIGKDVKIGAAEDGLRTLATHVSSPLGVVVRDLNKQSNNFTAEQVLRALGAEVLEPPGTWEKGLEAVARYLEPLGIERGSYRMENAAGLYDSNRFSAEQLATVIRAAARDFRMSSEYLSSLAVAATDGTLADRMADGPAERYVRGKTGTLLGTSCLSGVVGAPRRKPLVFSFLMNDVTDIARARAIQDQAAAALAAYLEGPRAVAGEPAGATP
jgi:D-alanyl-D-alanine carboxypeptidase/D-alanyl-D-alanine-endopeptidase (penicillin-binding protein 4)